VNSDLPASVAVLGAGSMGSAIAEGALAAGLPVRVTTRSAARAARATERGLDARSLEEHADANAWAVEGASLVVLAVKPAGIVDLAREVAGALAPGTAVVSVAAGIPLAALRAALPGEVEVLRAMPNTPAAIGRGVTGLAAADGTSEQARVATRAVFGTVGTVVEVGEDRIDALSAVSGSGPAYVFYFVEQLQAAAERLGFAPDEAAALVLGTVGGSVRLLEETALPAAELRRQVTSPKGTTERAIAVFDGAGMASMLDEAFNAAMVRARELAAG
jgi:pyrroline-5-carboxylate reductase